MRRILILIFFTTSMLLIPTLAKFLTDGFRVSCIKNDMLPFKPEWSVPMDAQVLSILDQPFHYFGKGCQCYVFESLDGQHVIKFFRFKNQKAKFNALTYLTAAYIAYNKLKEETGLVYIHLNQTENLLPTLHCKDAIGRSYKIDLDQIPFAIQKKAMPLMRVFNEALNHPELMKKRIDQFVDLLAKRSALRIGNTDPSLNRNFGFLEESAIEIDFGNYRDVLAHSKEIEMERYISKLRLWLNRSAPEWATYLDEKTKNSLQDM